MFRWHLGTSDPVEIAGQGRSFVVQWPNAEMKLEADQPLDVKQYKAPDATIAGSQDHKHTCVEVRSASAVGGLKVAMTVLAKEKPKRTVTETQ